MWKLLVYSHLQAEMRPRGVMMNESISPSKRMTWIPLPFLLFSSPLLFSPLAPTPSGPTFFNRLPCFLAKRRALLPVALTLSRRRPLLFCAKKKQKKTVIPFAWAPVIWSNSMCPSRPLIGQLSQVLMQGAWLAACYPGMNWLKPFCNPWTLL